MIYIIYTQNIGVEDTKGGGGEKPRSDHHYHRKSQTLEGFLGFNLSFSLLPMHTHESYPHTHDSERIESGDEGIWMKIGSESGGFEYSEELFIGTGCAGRCWVPQVFEITIVLKIPPKFPFFSIGFLNEFGLKMLKIIGISFVHRYLLLFELIRVLGTFFILDFIANFGFGFISFGFEIWFFVHLI